MLALLFAASTATATVAADPGTRVTTYALFGAAHNPIAVAAFVGFENRKGYALSDRVLFRELYFTWGAEMLLSGTFRPALFLEWSPIRILKLRAQYETWLWPGFHLGRGHGLVFPSPDSEFGEPELRRRKGEEVAAVGHRLYFAPTIQLRVWRIIAVNNFELATWYVHGPRSYWRDPLYDNLIRRGALDATIKNHALLLFELWSVPDTERRILAGGTFEVVRSSSAHITRHRTGFALVATPYETLFGVKRPTLFFLAGVNSKDVNRDGELWVNVGVRVDYDH